ncbi:hypothetical protein MPL3365_170101 [Mesorhizobium plurifarium]|uniref:Uncharacterized protein n=1 Tax=Mesorhizobium plurifarium TaxID=69974 RepID=A0A090GTD1_MESPL|nr:hypothetical protein MPL3365_170101 [Mesorhizobium plurifarium]
MSGPKIQDAGRSWITSAARLHRDRRAIDNVMFDHPLEQPADNTDKMVEASRPRARTAQEKRIEERWGDLGHARHLLPIVGEAIVDYLKNGDPRWQAGCSSGGTWRRNHRSHSPRCLPLPASIFIVLVFRLAALDHTLSVMLA